MVISRYIKFYYLSFFFILLSCDNYETINDSFNSIMITNWDSDEDSLKIDFFKYKKGSNFKIVESKNSDFIIENNKFLKILYLTPKFKNEGEINSDIVLTINDSLKYKFENIQSIRDTTHLSFTLGRRYTIFYKINATVNNQIIKGEDSFIVLDSKSSLKIKK
ncbi:hypothetical protein AX766_03520 [Flavobacterium covae]|nr:hypothetical protein AX766_03520 [Flavobacterium covae]